MLTILSKITHHHERRTSSLFQRDSAAVLAARLGKPRRFLQVVTGPRQVGKTTLVQQVLTEFDRPNVFVSADEPALRDRVEGEQASEGAL